MRNLCTVEGCTAVVLGNGLCKTHYHRMRRTGTTDLLLRPSRKKQCQREDCEQAAVAFGLCHKHYDDERAPLRRAARLAAKSERLPCAWCGGPVPLERRENAIYCSPQCKQHSMNERQRQDPTVAERARIGHMARKFNMTVDDYDRMLVEQDGGCAICGTTEPNGRGIFHVDHCHSTSKIRGLLCHHCNIGLGQFRDDPELLRAAIEYLERTSLNEVVVSA